MLQLALSRLFFWNLLPGGFILITLKEGTGTSPVADGRVFTLWSEHDLESIFTANDFSILDVSCQVSTLRQDDIWLGYLLRFRGAKPSAGSAEVTKPAAASG